MYRYLNPEQEILLEAPRNAVDAKKQIHDNIESILSWKKNASDGSRNACITCGFYLGRIAAVYRQFPELVASMKSEIAELNQVLNDIANGNVSQR